MIIGTFGNHFHTFRTFVFVGIHRASEFWLFYSVMLALGCPTNSVALGLSGSPNTQFFGGAYDPNEAHGSCFESGVLGIAIKQREDWRQALNSTTVDGEVSGKV